MSYPVLVAITGASGAIYGVEALRLLKSIGHPAHLILSEVARRTIEIETDYSIDEVKSFAEIVHSNKDQAACVSSGSYQTQGMLIAPCSIKTLSGIANSYNDNLIIRAADVTLKERRRLVLMVRETPLHAGHIRLMAQASEAGAIIFPPMGGKIIAPASDACAINLMWPACNGVSRTISTSLLRSFNVTSAARMIRLSL